MLAVNMVFSKKNYIIAVETKYVIIAIVRYRVLQILMVVVTCKSRQRIKRRTPFLVISYQSSPLPLSQTDRVQSIKLPKGPHFLLLPVGFNFENTIS